MIRSLVESAFQTGCLSVASEGLLYQVLATKCYKPQDLDAVAALCEAVNTGTIEREAGANIVMKLPTNQSYCS